MRTLPPLPHEARGRARRGRWELHPRACLPPAVPIDERVALDEHHAGSPDTGMKPSAQAQVWIGLAQVHQHAGTEVLMDRNRAYVNILAMARAVSEFEQQAKDACAALGFDLEELEEVEPFETRAAGGQVGQALLTLAMEAQSSGTPLFGAFHRWTSEDGAES